MGCGASKTINSPRVKEEKQEKKIAETKQSIDPKVEAKLDHYATREKEEHIEKSKNLQPEPIREEKVGNFLNHVKRSEKKKRSVRECFIQLVKPLVKKSITKTNAFHTVEDHQFDFVNFNVIKLTKYYKNQIPPKSKTDKFTDYLFPPNNNSIFGISSTGQHNDPFTDRRKDYNEDFKVREEEIEWARAENFFPGGTFAVFEGEIDFDDVNQGSVGNCYFLASLSALTEYDQLIVQIFRTLDVQGNGCYEIGMKINGEWKIVILDDYFPCFKSNDKIKQPIFSKPKNSELWVMLLEKAWAKINGGYINIISGWATEVLKVLTPFTVQSMAHETYIYKPDKMWEIILSADEKEYIMASSSKGTEEVESLGIVGNHAFTLIGAKEMLICGKKTRLVLIRNPWGFREWTGDWSDSSPLWTEEAKKAFGYQESIDKDDGLFWMSYKDFLKFFNITEICKSSSPDVSKTIKIPKNRIYKPNVFEIHIYRKCTLNLSVIRKNYRFNRKIPTDPCLVINLVFCRKNNDNIIEYVGSTFEGHNDPCLEIKNLPMGNYIIHVFANEKSNTFDKNRSFSLFISSDTYYEVFDKGIDENFILLQEIMINRIRSVKDNKDDKEYNQIVSVAFENTGYGYLYINNKTETSYILIGVDKSFNFNIINNFTGMENIPSRHSIIIIGCKNLFYGDFNFYVQYENKPSTSLDVSKLGKGDISMFLREVEETPVLDLDFDFIYKKVVDDLKNIIKKIDVIEMAKKYLEEKYPNEMKELTSLPPLDDKTPVIFKDKYESDTQDYFYLGEWKLKDHYVKHGRGWEWWEGVGYAIGYYKDDSLNGMGIMCQDGVKFKCNFFEGVYDGIVEITHEDGSISKAIYEKGEFIKELA